MPFLCSIHPKSISSSVPNKVHDCSPNLSHDPDAPPASRMPYAVDRIPDAMKLIVHGNAKRAIQYDRIFGRHIDVYEVRVDGEAVSHEAGKLHDAGLNDLTIPSI